MSETWTDIWKSEGTTLIEREVSFGRTSSKCWRSPIQTQGTWVCNRNPLDRDLGDTVLSRRKDWSGHETLVYDKISLRTGNVSVRTQPLI